MSEDEKRKPTGSPAVEKAPEVGKASKPGETPKPEKVPKSEKAPKPEKIAKPKKTAKPEKAPELEENLEPEEDREPEEDLESDKSPEELRPASASPPRSRSVFLYLAVLFGAAFLLLLFAFLMQQRDSQEITGYLSDLRTSMGNIQSIDQLREENRQLREESEGLKKQISDLEQERDELQSELEESNEIISTNDHSRQEILDIISALDTLARVRTLYEEERFEEACAILDDLPQEEGADLVEHNLTVYKNQYSGRVADPELYDPLEEWRALKTTLAEAEEN